MPLRAARSLLGKFIGRHTRGLFPAPDYGHARRPKLTWCTSVHTPYPGEFEWDVEKAALNFRKHGVRLTDAADALSDLYAVTREDPDSNGEVRHISLGMNLEGNVLVTVFAIRREAVRIISCRRATAAERDIYRRR